MIRILNEVDLKAVAGGESRAGRVASEVAKGAVNECSEDLLVRGGFSLVTEDNGEVQRVCADSRPSHDIDIGACGPPGGATRGRDRIG